MKQMNGESLNIVNENIKKIKEIFPEAYSDGKIVFEKLKQILGEDMQEASEKYRFDWNGKSSAIKLSQTPSTATLLPCKDDSINWDSTENLFIEGDNLEVLKLLQKTYFGSIKMIYIDPPYNTGKDFVYPDNFKNSIKNYLDVTGQIDETGRKKSTNSEDGGRYHTDWLNMMYPRLRLARNVLKEDGLIFVSIDSNEVGNLIKICDEIFGENNRIAQLIWNLKSGTQAGHFTRSHEYILVYAKNKSSVGYFKDKSGGTIKHGALKKISKVNPASEVLFPAGSIEFEGDSAVFTGTLGGSEKQFIKSEKMEFHKGKLVNDVIIEAGWAMKSQLLSWLNGNETFDSKGQKVIRFYFNSKGILFYEKERGTTHPKTVLSDLGTTKNGSDHLVNLLGNKYFDFPKPVELIKYLADLVMENDDILLDFFAGSATSAEAIMQLNVNDGGRRKFIMVQLPELLDENSNAYLDGYKTICDISRKRIKLVCGNMSNDYDVDLGFKSFKLSSSNIKAWSPDFEDLEITLDNMINNFVEGRSDEDILYEIMMKYGIEVTYPLDVNIVDRSNVYVVGFGGLFVCLSDDITVAVAEFIVEKQNELNPEITRVVFKDNGFKSDSIKNNIIQMLKVNGIQEIVSI